MNRQQRYAATENGKARRAAANKRWRESAAGKAWTESYRGADPYTAYVQSQQRSRRQQFRLLVDGMKNVPCVDCGGRFPPECMDFDHVRGEKAGNVGNMVRYTPAKAIAEMQKCEIVCANCHRTRTKHRRVNK